MRRVCSRECESALPCVATASRPLKRARPSAAEVLWLAILLLSSAPAAAQTAAFNPVPQGSPIPRILPPQPPAATPGGAPLAPAQPESEVPNRPVSVTHVSVVGVTSYHASEFAGLTQRLIGAKVPLPQIDAARQAILQRYRSDGYVLTTVSAHLDANGALRFVVTEGRIVDVKLDGDIGPAATQVLRFLNRLIEQAPITSATLERFLLLAQDVPGVTLRAVLKPSADDPGAFVLVAQVTRRAVTGLVTVDNRAYWLTGPVEGLAIVDLNSFTEFGEKTELSLYHTFPNSQTFGQASSSMFVGSSGLRVGVTAGSGPTNPTGNLADIGYRGTTTLFDATASYPVIRSREQTLNVRLSFDALQTTTSIDTVPNVSAQTTDSLRVVRLAADYTLADLWLGAERAAVNFASLRFSQGVSALGASVGSGPVQRVGATPDFNKIDFDLTRTQTLFHPWQGGSVALKGLLTGQWSSDILPSAEQFYLGGADYTRGYYSGEVQGDKALAATVELQLNDAYGVTLFGHALDVAAQYYVFYDWGETWQNSSLQSPGRIASTGLGTRLLFSTDTELDLEGLKRFDRYPNGNGPGITELNDLGFYWRVLQRF
jgi:hemolysin activation/secretion protein